jgi:hypothetical protein
VAGAAAQVRRPARLRRLPRLRGQLTRGSPRPRACHVTLIRARLQSRSA